MSKDEYMETKKRFAEIVMVNDIIANLEKQLAHKDRMIEAIAQLARDRGGTLAKHIEWESFEGEEIAPIIRWAEQKAEEPRKEGGDSEKE